MSYSMPSIDMAVLNTVLISEELAIVNLIHKNGVLKSSKPKPSKKNSDMMLVGQASYVWRMVAFQISPNGVHQCMPVTADWDIPMRSYDDRRKLTKELDILVDKVVNTVPKSQWYGIIRWGRALGAI